jgi:hypothetical protein
MNELMATKTAPVTQKVTVTALSMDDQFDASGVECQGLNK